MRKTVNILAIETSCDDTSAAVLEDLYVLSNVVSSQWVHQSYGGVVPELASRDHERNILPVVQEALCRANRTLKDIDVVAVTQGPGLIGSLLVGVNFAKGLALALKKPLILVDHMQAHVLAHFLRDEENRSSPQFPFIALTVSGGHTRLSVMHDYFVSELKGETLDDAAGEAFDKIAKLLGLGYPGGPMIDKWAATGNPDRFKFPHPQVQKYHFSFSGLKTAVLYFLRENVAHDPAFPEKNKPDIAASVQKTIVDILVRETERLVEDTGIFRVALAGGVSANSCLRHEMQRMLQRKGAQLFLLPLAYTTDNAAMIGAAGYLKYIQGMVADFSEGAFARHP